MPCTIGHTKHFQAHRLVLEALSTLNLLAADVNWTRQILSKSHEMFMHAHMGFIIFMYNEANWVPLQASGIQEAIHRRMYTG